jgi:hypothetical protein
MANTGHLAGLISELDSKRKGLDADIVNARKELEQAGEAVDKLIDAAERLLKETAQLENEIVRRSDNEAARRELQNRLRENEAQLAKIESQQVEARRRKDALAAANKEAAAKRRTEQAQIDFLIQIKPLLNSIKDRAVRFLFAESAIEACRAHGIGVSAFEIVAEKELVAGVLQELNGARDAATAEDRHEADQLREFNRLFDELTLAHREFVDEAQQTRSKQATLTARRSELQKEIGEIEAARKASEAEDKKRERGWFSWVGDLTSGMKDKYREYNLNSKKGELTAVSGELESLASAAAQRIKAAHEQLRLSREKLAKFEFGTPIPASAVNDNDPLSSVAERALAYRDRWQQKHPDMEKLFAAAPGR